MNATIKIVDGRVQFVYHDELVDLLSLGKPNVCRVSHVEFDNAAQGWTADMGPVGGGILGPFARREDALAAEHKWLQENHGF